jgi:hypothetical protein
MNIIFVLLSIIVCGFTIGSYLYLRWLHKDFGRTVRHTWFFCPFCLHHHKVIMISSNEEDTFYVDLNCPEVGLVTMQYTFRDKK